MKKIMTQLVAVFLLLSMMSGFALATSGTDTGEQPNLDDAVYIPEGYYNSAGYYFPPGYYFPDGSFIPAEEVQSPNPDETDEPTVPEDPTVPDDPVVPDVPSTPEVPTVTPVHEERIIRVGMHYGSGAMDGANLGNSSGASGFYFGYYDSNNQFVPVAYTTRSTISVVKTENVYFGTYNNYATYYDHLTNSSIGVGCYHLQLGGVYSTYEEALAVAGQYDGGFVAYISGRYYARIGNYLNRDAAVAAQGNLAMSGVSTELKGTSSYGLSVVIKGTNTIIFQYDDEGSGTGLGVVPIPTAEGQKCISVFDSVNYYGGFRYERIKGGDLTIVNMVDLEDYVNCVISQEMSDSWPIEALKAQAVAARSYAVTLRKHSAHHFDVCPTTCCQAYPGAGKIGENTTRATVETAGIYALYNGNIAQTFYYASNGGASESVSVVWGSNQATYPYLVGVVDPFEETISITGYEWTRTYTAGELAAKLRAGGYNNCSTIVSVKVTQYSNTGNPVEVTFTDDQGRSYRITASGMQKIFPLRSYRYEFANAAESNLTINGETPVDSLSGLYVIDGTGNVVPAGGNAYVITDSGVVAADGGGTVTGDVFTIVGKGWGHNIGMSQYGANAMAKLGYTYDQILKFYYTGITVGY